MEYENAEHSPKLFLAWQNYCLCCAYSMRPVSPSSSCPTPEATSPAVENYCKAIYELSGPEADRVSTSAIAARLHVSASSASSMFRSLSDMGLVTHVRYRGARLTSSGENVALDTIRNHRLIELFLSEVVGMPWDEVHSEAEVLEHVISDRLRELISEKLGDPKFDPHGDPIPDRNGVIAEIPTEALHSVEVGKTARIVRVSDADSAKLRALTEMGVSCGDELKVCARDPFDGMTHIHMAGRAEHLAMAKGIAEAIHVVVHSTPGNPA